MKKQSNYTNLGTFNIGSRLHIRSTDDVIRPVIRRFLLKIGCSGNFRIERPPELQNSGSYGQNSPSCCCCLYSSKNSRVWDGDRTRPTFVSHLYSYDFLWQLLMK